MTFLRLAGVAFAYPAEEPLFESLSFSAEGGLLGVVGPNGSGKSTFLALLAGALEPARGRISRGGAVALLRQEDAPARDPRSGGQWMRARLDAFLSGPEPVLLFDEPTHHLDASGRRWLFEVLAREAASGRTLVVASHDGELLAACESFIHLHPPSATFHGGPYHAMRADIAATRDRLHREAAEAARTAERVERGARETLARQEKRMREGKKRAPSLGMPAIALGTMKRNAQKTAGRLAGKQAALVREARRDREVAVALDAAYRKERRLWSLAAPGEGAIRAGRVITALAAVNVSHGGVPLWRVPIGFGLRAGERVRLAGPNGAGKSTVLRLLAAIDAPSEGEVLRSKSDVVYLPQATDPAESDATLLDFARDRFPDAPEGWLRERLGAFGFRGDAVFRALGSFSGGERVRARLARLALAVETCDALLLDEPSNHLDALAQDALAAMIAGFPGAVVMVTHDEAFASRFAWDDSWILPDTVR